MVLQELGVFMIEVIDQFVWQTSGGIYCSLPCLMKVALPIVRTKANNTKIRRYVTNKDAPGLVKAFKTLFAAHVLHVPSSNLLWACNDNGIYDPLICLDTGLGEINNE